MSTIITGEDYEKYLDHECYMTYVYDDPVPAWQEVIDFLMSSFHEPFSGKIEGGNTLLDIGSGPCIHTVISASNKVNEIYMSDYSQRNIDRLNRWLKGEIDMQTKQIKYVCQLENQGKMATIVTGEDYEKYLDEELYVTYNYDNPDPPMQRIVDFLMNSFHEAFAEIEGGNTLLDIGSGPCIHTVVSASNKVDEIYLSDYSQKSIDRLNSWLKGEIEIQTKQIKYVCELENKGQTVEERVYQMRKKIKQNCFIDVTKPGSLRGNNVPKLFDVVTSCWCVESTSQSLEIYKTCAGHISSLVNKEGYLVLFGSLNCTSYKLENNDEFPIIDISEPSVRKIYADVGFKILSFNTYPFVIEIVKGHDTKVFCMLAQKQF